MDLKIDARAAVRFNEIGEQVLLTVAKKPRQQPPQNHFRPDVHIAAHIDEKDLIGPVRTAQEIIDGTGAQVGRFFDHADHRIGLVDESFRRLLGLLERIQNGGLQQTVSMKTLLDTAFNWLKRRHGKVGDEQLVPYLLREIGQMVREQELWIPLHRVYLEHSIVIGPVRFETISKAMLDEREQQLQKRASPEDLPIVARRMERDRKRLQGTAGAVVVITAEPTRAEELAREKGEQAVALLRFFSPANWHPEMRSYCTLLGDEDLRMETILTVKEGKLSTMGTGKRRFNGDIYLSKIQPLLAGVTNKALASALGSSIPYASAVRKGRRVPHPRHWQALAELVGVSADFLKDGLAGHSPVSTNGAQKNGLS